MEKIAVIYWSGSGNTQKMAEAVLAGLQSEQKDAVIFQAAEFPAELAETFDGFAFGCSAMGAEELEESEFLPVFEKLEPLLKGKPVVLFGSYGWGDGEWMKNWEERIQQDGALLFTDGLMVHEAPDAKALEKCREFGRAFAKN